MCDPRFADGARPAGGRGLQRERRPPQCLIHHDEGPVRQLCGAEDDRRGRAHTAQDRHAQGSVLCACVCPSSRLSVLASVTVLPALPRADPAPHRHFEEVHLRQAHPGQAREVLHEERSGPGLDLRPPQRHHVMPPVFTGAACWSPLPVRLGDFLSARSFYEMPRNSSRSSVLLFLIKKCVMFIFWVYRIDVHRYKA